MTPKTSMTRKTMAKTTAQPRRLTATFFMTLDGVVENPGWSLRYWNDEIRAFKVEETDRTDALLLGRKTYEQFAKAWPGSTDEGAPFFNSVRKYVVSTKLTKDIWQNATFIATDVKNAIQRLKDEGGRDLTVHGSITLARWLIAEGLVDELRLLVYPVIVGKGRRLFEGDGLAAEFELTSSHATSNGVLALVYRPKK
jgi:dihydrofolate reductase